MTIIVVSISVSFKMRLSTSSGNDQLPRDWTCELQVQILLESVIIVVREPIVGRNLVPETVYNELKGRKKDCHTLFCGILSRSGNALLWLQCNRAWLLLPIYTSIGLWMLTVFLDWVNEAHVRTKLDAVRCAPRLRTEGWSSVMSLCKSLDAVRYSFIDTYIHNQPIRNHDCTGTRSSNILQVSLAGRWSNIYDL